MRKLLPVLFLFLSFLAKAQQNPGLEDSPLSLLGIKIVLIAMFAASLLAGA